MFVSPMKTNSYLVHVPVHLLNKIQNEPKMRVRVRVTAQVPVRVHAHLLNLSNIWKTTKKRIKNYKCKQIAITPVKADQARESLKLIKYLISSQYLRGRQ